MRIISPFLYFGCLLLTLGSLFRIQRWECAPLFQASGWLLLLGFFILLLVEVFSSAKAAPKLKMTIGLGYLLILVISYCFAPAFLFIPELLLLGCIYLYGLRRQFRVAVKKKNMDDFDSI